MRRDIAEAAAVAQELRDGQLLTGHHHDIVVEPGLIDRRETRIIERPDVDATHLNADLRAHLTDLNHRFVLLVLNLATTGGVSSSPSRMGYASAMHNPIDNAITSRRSIRRFSPTPVPRAVIAEI